NPDAPGFFIEWLHTREEVYSYTFDGDWFDVGTPRSYLEANAHLLDGESLVEEGATVEGSQVDGNSYVMSGAEVRDSRLSNTV
ncbi:MAG: NDP-sugar synthase, partial [Halobacteria archaeon]|nr:NDP-sugar synthase [Halobacteria archaeon]